MDEYETMIREIAATKTPNWMNQDEVEGTLMSILVEARYLRDRMDGFAACGKPKLVHNAECV